MKINIDTNTGTEGDVLARGANGRFSPKAPSALTPTALNVVTDDATNTGVTRGLTLSHTTSGTAGAGIGAGALFRAENAAGTLKSAGAVDSIHTTATDGAEVSALVLRAGVAGTLVEGARVVSPASAVNSVSITGSATGNPVAVQARGSDTDVELALTSKGAARVVLAPGGSQGMLAVGTADGIAIYGDSQIGATPTIDRPAGVVKVANGATSVVVNNSLAKAGSRCVATPSSAPTNAVYIKSAVVGVGTITFTLSGDPGAAGLEIFFVLMQLDA